MVAPTRRTTLDIGTAFEKHALRYLNDGLDMDLRRVGGAGDGGVDLRGWWVVNAGIGTPGRAPMGMEIHGDEPGPGPDPGPSTRRQMMRVKVVAQCKAEKKALGPRAVRELEGVISQMSHRQSRPGSDADDGSEASSDSNEASKAIAVLLSQSGFSKNAMVHATRSSAPLMLVHLSGGQPFDPTPPSPLLSSSSSSSSSSFSSSSPLPTTTGSKGEEPASVPTPHPESLWWNRALANIFDGRLEMRREVVFSPIGTRGERGGGGGGTRISLWMDGRRVERYSPVETV